MGGPNVPDPHLTPSEGADFPNPESFRADFMKMTPIMW